MKKLIPIFVVILIATLVLSACGSGVAPAPSGGAKTAPTEIPPKPVERPTEKPAVQPTEEPAANTTNNATPEGLDISSISSGLGDLDSYKASFTVTFEGTDNNGKPTTGTLSRTEEFVKNPAAKRTVITGIGAILDGNGGTPMPDQRSNSTELIEVGGKRYTSVSGFCSEVTSENSPQANTILDPNSIIGDVRGAQRIGNETVNEVPTIHYQLDVSALQTLGYLNGYGDVWVADPGNYVVKYIFQATATANTQSMFGSSLGEGSLRLDYEVTGVNQPISIQPPENCGATEDIPMMADAQDPVVIGNVNAYSSPSQFEDVVAFYEKEMKAQDWTETEGTGMSTNTMSAKNYTKGGRNVQIVITADASSGKTTVMITEQKK